MVVLGKCVHAILLILREEQNFDLSFTNHPILNQGRLFDMRESGCNHAAANCVG